MTKTFIFTCAEHQEFGENGWRLKSQPGFDPLGGMAVAHDCLEHFTDDDSVAAEFMALGASMFVRDENFYARHGKFTTNPGVHIASDMPDIMRHVLNEGYDFPRAPRTLKLDGYVEGWIDTMFQEYRKNVAEEYDNADLHLDIETQRSIRSYLRIGWRKAYKRYQGRDGEVQHLFCEIEEKADRYLKTAEWDCELHVKVDFSTLTARIHTVEPWEHDAD